MSLSPIFWRNRLKLSDCKILLAVPTYDYSVSVPTVQSLSVVQHCLWNFNVTHDVRYSRNCYISASRNHFAMDVLESDFTHLFFIDSDVGFDAIGFFKILNADKPICAGIYPMKTEDPRYPVQLKTGEKGECLGEAETGLLAANNLPTGFMCIQRHVLEILKSNHPELEYIENDRTFYDFFGCRLKDKRWWGDDYSFCNLWTEDGGHLWVYPDINFSHFGGKEYKGNLDKTLKAYAEEDNIKRVQQEEFSKLEENMKELRCLK